MTYTKIEDPKLDLIIQRTVDAPRERLWRAWTEPEHVKRWFTPAPWQTTECEIDLRPGGIFRFAMRGPEGERPVNVGCYLEIVPNERIVWSIAMLPGFRPAPNRADGVPAFTAYISFEASANGTKYTALARHRDEAGCKKHADMGFYEGWGACTDQLFALVTQSGAATS